MRCPNCNTKLDGNEMFCPECGCRIEEFQEEFREEYQDGFEEIDARENREKSKKPLIIAVIVLVAILVGGAIGVFGFNMLDGKDEESDKKQEEIIDEEDDSEAEDESEEVEAEEEEEPKAQAPKEEVPVTISMISNPGNLGGAYKLGVKEATATSVIDQKGHNNNASMVLDGKNETSWQEGVDGVGIDEKLWFDFNQESQIKYIAFKLGNWRTEDYHWSNNRPKTLELRIGDNTQMVTFPDQKQEFWVEVTGTCMTSQLEVTIKDVYRGTSSKWNDTCIAEIAIYGTTE